MTSTISDGEVASMVDEKNDPAVEEQKPAKRPTFERQNPTRNNSLPAKTMLSRRSSMHSATTSLWRRFRGGRRNSPVDPALKRVEREEGAPVPRGEPVKCSSDEVFDMILPKENEPEFDGLGSYILVQSVHERLWRMEADRLLDIVRNPDRPLQFSNDKLFKQADEEGYRELSSACQKILTAISICLLDDECIVSEYCSKLTSRGKLMKLIRMATMRQNTSQASDHDTHSNRKANETSLDSLFCLVNYISAVLARLITQTSPGHYWQCNVLSVLIKRVTKIKVLLYDLQAYSAVAVRAGEAVLDKMAESGPVPDSVLDDEEECEEILRMIEANEKAGLASLEEKEIAAHCVEQMKFRVGINDSFRFILMSMRFTNRSGLPATTFELCGVVYETGFEGFKSLLFQDRDLEYSATSDLDTLNTAHSAFSILSQTVTHLKENQDKEPPPKPDRLETYVEWAYIDAEKSDGYHPYVDLAHCKTGPIRLRTMEEIITVMVPLFTTCPSFLSEFTNFRCIMALTGNIREDVEPYEEGHFSAFFRMYTNDFDKGMDQRDVLRLSEALKSGFFSRCSLMSGSTVRGYTYLLSPDQDAKVAHTIHKMNELTKEMDKWVIDENSVTVLCGWYVWPIIAISAILAIGGLAIAFSVGSHIKGVDPSNLATYSWVVSAFIIVIAKSVHVKEWAWNDFLHCRVRCCSVSELHAITGINEQLIMAKLLHDEGGGSVLKIRGPYNSCFRKRSSEGFSIDSPIYTGTLLLSGLTMLKVVTPRGHALVCLDSRRGADLAIVYHQAEQSKELLVCENINTQRENKAGAVARGNEVRLALTRSNALKWKRVQGIYKVMDARFT